MLPNTFEDLLYRLAETGSDLEVECLAPVETEWEDYPDQGIRLTITDGEWHQHGDGIIVLHVSYEKYDEYNLAFEKRTYWDDMGGASWTAREAGCYKVKSLLCVMENDDPNKYFTELSCTQGKYFSDYTNNRKDDETYVQFLERRLTRAMIGF